MNLTTAQKLLILFAAWLLLSGGLGGGKVTSAVYTYEKDSGGIPSQVAAGIDKLNREKGIIASHDEVDTTDGDGEIPDQYKVSRPAAVKAGLPALVVLAGDRVVRVVKDPRTVQAVLEAVP